MKAYQQLWHLITYRPWLYFFNFVLALLGWLLFLVPAYVSKHFFDSLTGHSHQILSIWGLLIFLAGGHIARIIIFLINRFVDVTFIETAGALLRNNIFNQLYRNPQRLSETTSGEVVNKLRDDVDEVGQFMSFIQLLDVIGSALFSILALAMMLRINVMITLLVFLPLLGVTLIAQHSRKRIDQLRTRNRAVTQRTMNFINDLFTHAQAIKLNNVHDKVANKLNHLNDERSNSNVNEALFGSIITSTYSNVVQLGTGIILLLAANAMSKGKFTVGDFALFTYFLTWITTMIVRFGTLTTNYNRLKVSLNRINELTASPQSTVYKLPHLFGKEGVERTPQTDWAHERAFSQLKVQEASFHYPNSKTGIHKVSFTIKTNRLTVITGRVGSGKSTLIKLLLGILPLDKGDIYWNDKNVSDPHTFFVPPRVTYVSQQPYLLSDTIKNNILLGEKENNFVLDEVLDITSLNVDLNHIDDHLEAIVGSRGGKLSGGQKQRVATARALYRPCDVIVVDDLSSALDSETEHTLWKKLLKSNRYKAMLAISHSPFLLKEADHILVLKDGEIESEGKLEELLKCSPEMQALWQT